MRIDNLMQTDVLSISPANNLLAAACSMRAGHVGSLAVVRHETLTGIITEKDLVRAMAEMADSCEARVSEYMTSNPAVATPDEDSVDVARRMTALRVRHLPVVNDVGTLVGMVSARDIAGLEAWPKRGEGQPCVA